MPPIMLPKKALEKIHIGQAFAEYDIIRDDPELFVSTPSTIAALSTESKKCFFVGRRGAGKTAIAYELQRKFPHSSSITPQIFDLLNLPLAHEEFRDTRQRPFKSLMHTMERALIDEVLRQLILRRMLPIRDLPPTVSKERNLIEDCDFDQRVLNFRCLQQESGQTMASPDQSKQRTDRRSESNPIYLRTWIHPSN
jgi:hypothetical protein